MAKGRTTVTGYYIGNGIAGVDTSVEKSATPYTISYDVTDLMGNAAGTAVREIYVVSPCTRTAACPTRSLCPALSTDREVVCQTCDDQAGA